MTYSENTMPETNITLEVQHTHHHLTCTIRYSIAFSVMHELLNHILYNRDTTFSIVAGDSECTTVTQHGSSCHCHTHHTAILASFRLYICSCLINRPRRRTPVFGRLTKVFTYKPLQLGPTYTT